MVNTIWKERKSKTEANIAAVEELTEECGLTPLSARLLVKRGYDTADKAMAYLEPDFSDFYDPFGLPDMQKAVDRLLKAREQGEKVCIYGDYDADGTTAVSILMRYFKGIGIEAFYRIPNRLEEGYGMNIPALEAVIKMGATLIVSVDNGIAAHEQVDYCNEQGVDVIVTDHHECQGEVPRALAVVDAKREDSDYPFSELCGAGIALKMVMALDRVLELDSDLQEYIECAAIATVADIVPLKSENRIIASLGIDYLNTSPVNLGIRALIEVSELKRVNAGNIGFVIAPKINAAGRLGEAGKVVELYMTQDEAQAAEIAAYLSMENRKRQDIEQEILELAKAQVEQQHLDEQGIMVVAGDGWHPGVIGIVASKLQETWYHPVVVIGIDEKGMGKGSCRSVEGFNIFEALQSCSELFTTFGGHEQAAGLSISAEDIPQFAEKVNDYASEKGIDRLLTKTMYYDSVMGIGDVSEALAEELDQFEPYGVGNPGPVFLMEGLKPQDARKMGSDKTHLMFLLPPYRCVGFGMGAALDDGTDGQFSILCKPEINCFRDKKSVQLLLKDIKRSPFYHNQSAYNLVERIKNAPVAELPELGLTDLDREAMNLTREDLKLIYALMRQVQLKGAAVDQIVRKFETLNVFKLLVGLNILQESELIRFRLKKGVVFCEILASNGKKDIQKAPLMVKLRTYLDYE